MYYDLKSAIRYFPNEVSQQEMVIHSFAEERIHLTNIEIKDISENKTKFEMNGMTKGNLKLFFHIKMTFGMFSNAIDDVLCWELYAYQKENNSDITELTAPVIFTMNEFYKLDFNNLLIQLLIEPNVYKYYYKQIKNAISENENLEIVQDSVRESGEFILECTNGLHIRATDSDLDNKESNIRLIIPKEQGIKLETIPLYYEDRLVKAFLTYLKTGSIMISRFDIVRLMTFVNTHKAFEIIKFTNRKLYAYIPEHQIKEFVYPNIQYHLFKGHFQTKKGLIFPIEMNISTNFVFKIRINSHNYMEKFTNLSDFEEFVEELYNL